MAPDIDIAPSGTHSGARVYIRRSMSTPAGQLRRPLIVVEGFDINDAAPNLADNYNVNALIDEWTNRVFFNGNNYNSWLDDEAGYDLVFVDWRNSTDHITRNANLLEDIINRVNNLKAQSGSAEQNVVMGLSMGGLISRYCLASMTKRNVNPQTRLLITHDSPHQGAYVPLAFQHMVLGLQNVSVLGIRLGSVMGGSLDEAATLLQTPAAQQQLNMVVTDANGTVAQNTFLATTYRDMITFSTSDPQPLYQFIATSQGSQCGLPSMPVGSTLVNGHAQGSISGFASMYTAGIISKWKYDVEVNAKGLTGNASNQILHFRLERKQRLFYGLISNNKVISLLDRFEPAFNTIPWESVPAGTEGLADRLRAGSSIESRWSLIGQWFIGMNANFNLGDRFSFVPVVSALDAVTVNNTTVFGTYIRGAVTSSLLRVDDFIAQETVMVGGGGQQFNLPHTAFTPRNSRWQYNLMENIGFVDALCDLSCPIPDFVINGNSNICSTSTFNAPLIQGATYNWQPTSSSLATITPNNNSVTVTKSGAQTGSINLSVTVTTACDSRTESTLVNILGGPQIDLVNFTNGAGGEGYFCTSHTGNQFESLLSFTPPNSSIEYRLLSWPCLNVVYTDPNLYPTGVPISVGSSFAPGWYVLEVKVNTPCGSTDWTGFEVEFMDCSELGAGCPNCYFALTASPNPTDGDLKVTIEKEKSEVKKLDKSEKVSYVLYDLNRSLMVKQWAFDNSQNQRTLNVRGIKAGQYILVVTKGKYRQSTQIIIR